MEIKDSGERTTFITGAQRDNGEAKGRFSLISPAFLQRLSFHIEMGAAKYSDRNWEKGMPLSRYVDAIFRHLAAFMQGDNSENHLGALAFNIMALSHTYDMVRAGKLPAELNDLPYVDMGGDLFPLEKLFIYSRPKLEPPFRLVVIGTTTGGGFEIWEDKNGVQFQRGEQCNAVYLPFVQETVKADEGMTISALGTGYDVFAETPVETEVVKETPVEEPFNNPSTKVRNTAKKIKDGFKKATRRTDAPDPRHAGGDGILYPMIQGYEHNGAIYMEDSKHGIYRWDESQKRYIGERLPRGARISNTVIMTENMKRFQRWMNETIRADPDLDRALEGFGS